MEAIKEKLNAHQLKATPTRIGVLELLNERVGATPFSLIQQEFVETDRITLFRTLNTLLDSGIVHKAHFANDETYYALCPSTCSTTGHLHNHVHFKCTNCKTVICKTLPEAVKIEIPDVVVQKIDINVMGICNDCC